MRPPLGANHALEEPVFGVDGDSPVVEALEDIVQITGRDVLWVLAKVDFEMDRVTKGDSR